MTHLDAIPIEIDAASEQLKSIFESMVALTRAEQPSSYSQRIEQLNQIEALIKQHVDDVVEAINSDFGCRSRHEVITAEIFTSLAQVKYTKKQLKRWMKPQSRHVDLLYQPATAKVIAQPKGVVGIISPWNYPFYLAMAPLITAIAAGNRVMLKPSELTSHTSQLLKNMLAAVFDDNTVYVGVGGVELGIAFSDLPFDHLLFTGSTQLGKIIMAAAAKNLTPVTLELGGKSPLIIHSDYPLQDAVKRIIHTKTINGGQTCVAPDYILVHEQQLEPLVEELDKQFKQAFAHAISDPDYTAIINENHYRRLKGYLDDAAAKGARILPLNPVDEVAQDASHKMPLTLVLDASADMRVLQDEIFGPILPLVSYSTLDEAIAYVNANPRPLALYYFDDDTVRQEYVLSRTVSGNACINEAILHVVVDDMPFGGVGPSGMGAYHGQEGFDTFSHKKGVLSKGRFNTANFIRPPYSSLVKRIFNFLVR